MLVSSLSLHSSKVLTGADTLSELIQGRKEGLAAAIAADADGDLMLTALKESYLPKKLPSIPVPDAVLETKSSASVKKTLGRRSVRKTIPSARKSAAVAAAPLKQTQSTYPSHATRFLYSNGDKDEAEKPKASPLRKLEAVTEPPASSLSGALKIQSKTKTLRSWVGKDKTMRDEGPPSIIPESPGMAIGVSAEHSDMSDTVSGNSSSTISDDDAPKPKRTPLPDLTQRSSGRTAPVMLARRKQIPSTAAGLPVWTKEMTEAARKEISYSQWIIQEIQNSPAQSLTLKEILDRHRARWPGRLNSTAHNSIRSTLSREKGQSPFANDGQGNWRVLEKKINSRKTKSEDTKTVTKKTELGNS
jgi:hypothetical protein